MKIHQEQYGKVTFHAAELPVKTVTRGPIIVGSSNDLIEIIEEHPEAGLITLQLNRTNAKALRDFINHWIEYHA